MSGSETPSSVDEGIGRVLRELHDLRSEIRTRDSDRRDEIEKVRAIALRAEHAASRAEEAANAAKRVADSSAHDTKQVHAAVLAHTTGLVERVDRVEKTNADQNTKLDVLVKAEDERKIREKTLEEASEKRWKSVTRWWPIVMAVGGGAGYLLAHWKP